MSDMNDPRFDPSDPEYRRANLDRAGNIERAGLNWSWVLGGLGALVLVLLALSYWGGYDEQMASDMPPPATTGQSLPESRPQTMPPATTGQSQPETAPVPREAPATPPQNGSVGSGQ
jgi:hypothetical protein